MKLQRGFKSFPRCWENLNIQINGDNIEATYFCHGRDRIRGKYIYE